MDKTVYEQRIIALSDKMRKKLIDTGDAQRLPDDAFIPIIARIAVAEMAEIAKNFHYAAWTSRAMYDAPADGARVGQLEYMLQQQGLIPDNAPEGGQDE